MDGCLSIKLIFFFFIFAAAYFLKWSTGWRSLEKSRTFTCLVTCNTVYACYSSTKNTPKHQTARIMANKIQNLNGKVFCVITVFKDLWCRLFYHLLFLPEPLSHHLLPPTTTTTILSYPSQDEVSIRGERQEPEAFFTANNGKSHTGLFFFFFFLPLLQPQTNLYSQAWHQIDGLIEKRHSHYYVTKQSVLRIAIRGLSYSSQVNRGSVNIGQWSVISVE